MALVLKNFMNFIKDIIKSRHLILGFAVADFKERYLGSYLGILWAFLQPCLTLFIFWFVFELGFRSKPTQNYPFILWFATGMIAWFFISETLQSAATSIIEKKFLVSKVVFRVSLLPLIKILSGLFTHLFFVIVLAVIFMVYGYSPNIYYLQIPYYLIALLVLLIGISWITSSLIIFLPDVGPAMAMIIQFSFWLTPIVWSIDILPKQYQIFIKLNPFYYIIEGYRNCFMYHRWFWEDVNITIYYWVVTLVIFVVGAVLFRRLRPHFADVL